MEYLPTLLTIWAFTVIFPSVVHELGHYAAACLFKVPVKIFSIGIGKPLLKYKDSNGTLWQLGRVPIGGYIRTADSLRQVLRLKNPHSRLKAHVCIGGAGPLLEIFIGVSILLMVGMAGEARPPARIGVIAPNSPIALSGLSVDDVIINVNGNSVHGWSEFFEQINLTNSGTVILGTPSRQHLLNVPGTLGASGNIGYKDLGAFPSYGYYNLTVHAVPRDFPARKAGIKRNDTITKINELAVKNWTAANYELIQLAGSTVTVAIRRQGVDISLPVTLNSGNSQFSISGIIPEFNSDIYKTARRNVNYGYWRTLENVWAKLMIFPVAAKDILVHGPEKMENFDHPYRASAPEILHESVNELGWKLLWIITGLLMITTFIDNLIPWKIKKFRNDGWKMFSLTRVSLRLPTRESQ